MNIYSDYTDEFVLSATQTVAGLYTSAQRKLPAFFRRLLSVVMFSRPRFHTRCAERTMTETAKVMNSASTLYPRKNGPKHA